MQTSSTMMHAVPGNTDTFDVNINRTFTRLVDVYQTWLGQETSEEKAINMFYSPALGSAQDTVRTFISAGDRRHSMFDRSGQAELLQRLGETLGTSNSFQGYSFDRKAFDHNSFVNAFDMEASGSHATGTGMNLSHGQLLKIHVQGAGKEGFYVQRAYTTCRFDQIVELTSTGCSVHN